MTEASSRANLEFEEELICNLEAAVPGSCARAAHFDNAHWPRLSSEEREALARAVEKRRREFAAGRYAAKQGANALGLELTSLPVGGQREPCWPRTLVGSITHDNTSALAWVAPSATVGCLGLDVEQTGRLKKDTWRLLFTRPELDWLAAAEGDTHLALRLFSAKESIYKCLFPRVKRYVGYKEVTLSAAAQQNFDVALSKDLAQESAVDFMQVRCQVADHRLATFCWLPVEDPRESSPGSSKV